MRVCYQFRREGDTFNSTLAEEGIARKAFEMACFILKYTHESRAGATLWTVGEVPYVVVDYEDTMQELTSRMLQEVFTGATISEEPNNDYWEVEDECWKAASNNLGSWYMRQ